MDDCVIVGGGSAGCVLANRLSADPRLRVTLIEAGPDTPPEHISEQIYSLPFLPHYFEDRCYWTKLKVYVDPVGNYPDSEIPRAMRQRRYEQARVMGGGSTVNGQVAIRGLPSDYDEWDSAGARGWSYQDCLPYFRRLERDLDFDGPYHGKEGPIPIHRTFPPDWGGLSLAFRDALSQNGIGYFDDCHTHFGDGCFPFPKNNAYAHRVSAALGYLDSATRLRPNLQILADRTVERVEFAGRRAVAVTVLRHGQRERIAGKQIIVCAGALHSPAVLMRSGIGPAEHLQEHGITVVADLPGVGANLQDHPLVGFGLLIQPEGRLPPTLRNNFLLCARFSSGHPDCPPQDMKLSVSNRFAWTQVGARLGTVQFGPNKVYSRGFVRLRTAEPDEEPLVAFNLLSDSRDLQRTIEAARFVGLLLRTEPVAGAVAFAFPGIYAEMQRNLSMPSGRAKLLSSIGAWLLDRGGIVSRAMMRAVASPRTTLERVLNDEEALIDWIRRGVQGDWHACGTCRMGAEEDRMAVVDAEAQVYGVENLRVVDASIMPTVPCANTNITTIMIGEKIADAILKGSPSSRCAAARGSAAEGQGARKQ